MLFQNFNFVFVSHYTRGKGIKASAHPKIFTTFGFLTLIVRVFVFICQPAGLQALRLLCDPLCVSVCVLSCSYFYCSVVVVVQRLV